MPSFAATDSAREEEEDRRRDSLYEQRWDELYKDRGFSTRVSDLVGKPCLLLPYGHEIMGEASNRFQLIPAIRDVLKAIRGFSRNLMTVGQQKARLNGSQGRASPTRNVM